LQQSQVIYFVFRSWSRARGKTEWRFAREIFEKRFESHYWYRGRRRFRCLEQYYYLIHLTDWISYYLAKENGIDPDPVEVIDFLKGELAKFEVKLIFSFRRVLIGERKGWILLSTNELNLLTLAWSITNRLGIIKPNCLIKFSPSNRRIEILPANEQQPTNNYLLFCEHSHVFLPSAKSGDEEKLSYSLLRIFHPLERAIIRSTGGGDITYHGARTNCCLPGHWPRKFSFTDIHQYMRTLEEAVIATLKKRLTWRRAGSKGWPAFWLDWNDEKTSEKNFAALGVKTQAAG